MNDMSIWAVALWIVWIALGLAYETIALLDSTDHIPPLTWVVVRYIPWAGVAFGGWLFAHFLRRVIRRKKYLKGPGSDEPS